MSIKFPIEKGGEGEIYTKLLGGIGILLLVVSIWSVTSVHSAQAKGMPYCWLNPDGTVKDKYLPLQKSVSPATKYPIPILKRDCKN